MSKVICIDPGHGGYDPGACAGGAREKDITLYIGLQLRDLLRKAGFKVVMTREADVSPGGYTEVNADLRERCRISNAAGADVFLSIHVNAGGGRGAEIYSNGDGGTIAELARGIINNVATVCGTHGQAVRDGGANGAGWAVIRGTQADAMLVEIGFIDSEDLGKIQQHIDEFALLIARAFCAFFGVAYPTQQAALDQDVVQKVVAVLGALHSAAADPRVQQAAHFAADAARVAAGIITAAQATADKSFSAQSAQYVINHLGTLHAAAESDVQDAAHFAADALRDAAGIQKN